MSSKSPNKNVEQPRDGDGSHTVDRRVATAAADRILPQHACRRHAAEASNSGGSAQPIATANGAGPRRRTPARWRGGSCASMKSASSAVRGRTGATRPIARAEHAGCDDQDQELQHVQAQHFARARTETLHERDRVEAARDEAPRRHRDGDAAQQHADERREHQEPLGVGDRRVRPRAGRSR